jgi:hypothetical protein
MVPRRTDFSRFRVPVGFVGSSLTPTKSRMTTRIVRKKNSPKVSSQYPLRPVRRVDDDDHTGLRVQRSYWD